MSGALPQLLFIGAIIVAFWFLVIRPQQLQRKKHEAVVASLAPGVRVLTIGGIYATVVELDGDDVVVELSEGVQARIVRGAVSTVVDDSSAKPNAESTDHSDHDDPPVGDAEPGDEGSPDSKAHA